MNVRHLTGKKFLCIGLTESMHPLWAKFFAVGYFYYEMKSQLEITSDTLYLLNSDGRDLYVEASQFVETDIDNVGTRKVIIDAIFCLN